MRDTKDEGGRPSALGATVCSDRTNFSIFSSSASGMQLLLFDHTDDPVAARTVNLDPMRNRTGTYSCLESNQANCMDIAQIVLVIL